ncbi:MULTISPECIES: MarR family winged helix-turn-helix transcriptional regulator [Caproicibacterium]|jgi:DNA-binding MarR family transcriptional regulator|nr:MarR family transcriptional regulator [Caproicibacterium lactatifermentans]ARP50806.1 hypothetical protein B6259_07955 [Ruminococcaceae bacterium CPB6]MDD4807694.1 MarR family transcriptional regulator [Oscillospiraceae bacterium]QKO29857.1 MarR family transcriptional regulator [Caproicibacterium lactatifermentans]
MNAKHSRLFAAASRVRKTSGRMHRLSGITPGEWFVLCHLLHLQQEHDVRASDLGRQIHMSRSAISQMLRSLEQKGLIERTNSERDRRVVYVRMTDSGRDRYQELTAVMAEKMDRVLGSLGEEKEEQLTSLLNELADAMQDELT